MLRFLTQKLRPLSINEVQPLESSGELEDQGYSSTDSETDNVELKGLERGRQHEGNGTYRESPKLEAKVSNPQPSPNQENIQACPGPSPMGTDLLRDRRTDAEFMAVDRHSSEEELEHIIREKENMGEKRKWSQVNRWSLNGDSSGSSDDEVKDLMCGKVSSPVVFTSSPPKRHVQKVYPAQGERSQLFIARVRKVDGCASPRKRHRQAFSEAQVHAITDRPSLDFEKMQQQMLIKKPCTHGVRSRIVKIRTISNRTPPRIVCDPSVFSFRPLTTLNPLTPVEEPTPTCAF
ncbi:uncharacterized protein [Branchiostoma lanceolatum]|uniref:Hypp2648 protein n=1 Tax=Branchiostoma lanceolatum TaxID=7740 RepID=A0A8J9ZW46_BRALA|nr:Hypp2648 [Branchiostoma lanceolatum]